MKSQNEASFCNYAHNITTTGTEKKEEERLLVYHLLYT